MNCKRMRPPPSGVLRLAFSANGTGAPPERPNCKKIRTFFCRYPVNLSVKVNRGLVTLGAEKRHFGTASAALNGLTM